VLKTIAAVTLLVRSLAAVEPAWRADLGYETVARGEVPAEVAAAWDAPAMQGRPFVLMQPASGAEVYLRFVEAPPGTPAAEPFMTHGWNAVELLVTDPDAMAKRLENSAFRVIGPPRDLMAGEKAPRAMQVLGPADEVLYLTRIIPGGLSYDLGSATSPVDRVFIMVAGGPSIDALRDFYGRVLGLPLGKTESWRIGVLAKAHGLPDDSRFPLAVAELPRNFLVELDGYPPTAKPRPAGKGALPPGIAMVSFTVERLDALDVDWRSPPRALAGLPYAGRRVGVTVGPAGEWVEVVEEARGDMPNLAKPR
jgi:catechol 2,3-dioxygenase-like lactoylglutathione lyase family enzyme